MDQRILDYLASQNICVLAVEMPDGSPHAATVHFASNSDASVFYFETNKNYRKSEALFGRPVSRASLVVGTNEVDMKTFQADGEIRLLTNDELAEYEVVYLGKFPKKKEKMDSPDAVRFVFIPSWWRYTDFKHKGGKLILTSN